MGGQTVHQVGGRELPARTQVQRQCRVGRRSGFAPSGWPRSSRKSSGREGIIGWVGGQASRQVGGRELPARAQIGWQRWAGGQAAHHVDGRELPARV